MKRAVVNYVKTLREGDAIHLPDGSIRQAERITKAQGRKPPKGGENIFVHSNGEKIRFHTDEIIRIFRAN